MSQAVPQSPRDIGAPTPSTSPASTPTSPTESPIVSALNQHIGKKPRKPRTPRFTPTQRRLLGALTFASSIIAQITIFAPQSYTFFSILRILSFSLFAAYLPSYFDGSENCAMGRQDSIWIRDLPFWPSLFNKHDLVYDKDFVSEMPNPDQQCIVLLSPHGLFSIGHWLLNTCHFTRVFGKNRRSIAADIVFNIPLYRDVMLSGGLVNASRHVVEEILDSGRTLVGLPGGQMEQVMCKNDHNGPEQAIYIKSRKGLFKYALKYDLKIFPVYAMNEVSCVRTSSFLQSWRNYIAKRFWFPIYFATSIPDLKEIYAYGGSPVYLKMKGGEPTDEEVDQLQEMYIAEVTRIYEHYKGRHGFTGPLIVR